MNNENTETERCVVAAVRRKRRLARFAPLFRERIAALTCCAPQAEDLTESFPGLLVALISDYGTPSARQKTFDLVLEGGSIRAAARTLELPLWLRKMPPEAFREPISHLPCEAQFTSKIANFIPRKPNTAGDWLEQVSFADEACGSSFALWVAKHCGSVAASRRKLLFPFMGSWVWHANRPDTIGYSLIDTPWSPKMGLRRATEELMRWRRRVELACLLGDGIETPWLKPGIVADYEFVPLLTLEDFIDESRAMNNCLDQYSDRLGTGLIRIFSMRRQGKRIADLEIGTMSSTGLPSIVQIKGPNNAQAAIAVWQAAQQWLEAQPLQSLPRRPGPVRSDGSQGDLFWQAYLDCLPRSRREYFKQSILARRRSSSQRTALRPIVGLATAMIDIDL